MSPNVGKTLPSAPCGLVFVFRNEHTSSSNGRSQYAWERDIVDRMEPAEAGGRKIGTFRLACRKSDHSQKRGVYNGTSWYQGMKRWTCDFVVGR